MEAATARLGRGKRRSKKDKSYGSEERRLATLLLSPAMVVIALVAAYPLGAPRSTRSGTPSGSP
jgi:hypothetical protein